MAIIFGKLIDERLDGTEEDDEIYDSGGRDWLLGHGGADRLFGGPGDDKLEGGAGADFLDGQVGYDLYVIDDYLDTIRDSGVAGETNTGLVYLDGYQLAFDANIQSIELVEGSAARTFYGNGENVTIKGNSAANVVIGSSGAEFMYGWAGGDTLVGGAGRDSLYGEGPLHITGIVSNDSLDGGAGADFMLGGPGDDSYTVENPADEVWEYPDGGTDTVFSYISWELSFGDVENLVLYGATNLYATGNGLANTINGSLGDNYIWGGGANDQLYGYAGNDEIDGSAGDDFIDGGGGTDAMSGGEGDDTFVVDSASDAVTELANEGIDTVLSSVSKTLFANVENLTLTGASALNAVGNALANTIIGTAGNNTLLGDGGADFLDGMDGFDVLRGGDGDDFVFGRNGGGTLYGDGGNDRVDGGVDADTIYGGGGDDELRVGDGSNVAHGEAGADNLLGASGIDRLYGGDDDDLLRGISGNDILDGGLGVDELHGGFGDDWFYVDTNDDRVRESAGGGNDRVLASASFSLHATLAEVEVLKTTNDAGTAAINLTGSSTANHLLGNAGANQLNGRIGADVMQGLGGADWYFVDNAADRAVEAAGGGSDRVLTSASFTLEAGSEVELLMTTDAAATTAINITGNAFANQIYGNAGSNRLDGKAGADNMSGLGGDDFFYVDNVSDRAVEAVGQGSDRVLTSISFALEAGSEIEIFTTSNNAATTAMNLTGNAFANLIVGNAGQNIISGGLGNDTLFGLGGPDHFLFNTALGAGNLDTVRDFDVAADFLRLENAVFTALAAGGLAAGAFRIGAAAADADDRVIYNNATGALIYDTNGNGAGAATQFATLSAGLALSSADFIVA